jgi:hypothetical protein
MIHRTVIPCIFDTGRCPVLLYNAPSGLKNPIKPITLAFPLGGEREGGFFKDLLRYPGYDKIE